MLTRSGARVGDYLLVTGVLGASRAGLEGLRQFPGGVPDRFRHLVEAHLQPKPRLREAQALGECGLVSAAIDISDGLTTDLHNLCAASGVGAEVWPDRLPLAAGTGEIAGGAGLSAAEMALQGGEDYELLFTVRPGSERDVIHILGGIGAPATVIGRITPADGVVASVGADQVRRPLQAVGWDHFRAGAS
jgi:thiamine-monophosphate kinase